VERAEVIRILLVEDEIDVADLLRMALVSAGWKVDIAENAASARRQLLNGRYDIVVADWRLPDGDGLSIADIAADTGAKTILMSGYLFLIPEGDAARHELLMKPMRPTELTGVVKRVLDIQ
jgi:DNA-binding response OmpR family regulator